ncbi:MAG: type II methionyl aminopeptidase [Thermoplasmatota archaeon]
MPLPEEVLDKYRLAGRIAREARDYGVGLIREGASMLELANTVEALIISKGARPAFPVNIAVNDVAAHFTPRHDETSLVFRRGDVVKLDVGAQVDGYIGDTARTVEVGTDNWRDMRRAAEEALSTAIEMLRPGVDLGMVGAAIESAIASRGFKSIENLTGHSLERGVLHAGISVPNVRDRGAGVVREGDVLAVEPFATNGMGRVDGRRNSSIYRFVRKRFARTHEARALLREVELHFGTLPFSERWCMRYVANPVEALDALVRAGAVSFYPTLREVDGGIVAQAEHTVVVGVGSTTVTT